MVDYYLSDEGIAAVEEADYVALDAACPRGDAGGLGRPLTEAPPPAPGRAIASPGLRLTPSLSTPVR